MGFIYFYDLNEVLLDRYPAQISREINQRLDPNKHDFIFLYSEKYAGGVPRNLPNNARVYFLPSLSIRKIEAIVSKYPPECLVTVGMRLPDMFMIALFKRHRSRTIMVQHGLFVDHLQRVGLHKLLWSKFIKVMKYLKYSHGISVLTGDRYLVVLRALYEYFISGRKNLPDLSEIKTEILLADEVLSFDSSWDDYYQRTYGYAKSQFRYIGNPDYELVRKVSSNKEQKIIMYVCQTLVEDGRYSKSEYLSFLNDLKKAFKEEKVYLKLHPRSDSSLYRTFDDDLNFEVGLDYRNTDVVYGHYSSLLKVAQDAGKHVVIYELPGHRVPDYYRDLVEHVHTDIIGSANEIDAFRRQGNVGALDDDLRAYLKQTDSAYGLAAIEILGQAKHMHEEQ